MVGIAQRPKELSVARNLSAGMCSVEVLITSASPSQASRRVKGLVRVWYRRSLPFTAPRSTRHFPVMGALYPPLVPNFINVPVGPAYILRGAAVAQMPYVSASLGVGGVFRFRRPLPPARAAAKKKADLAQSVRDRQRRPTFCSTIGRKGLCNWWPLAASREGRPESGIAAASLAIADQHSWSLVARFRARWQLFRRRLRASIS